MNANDLRCRISIMKAENAVDSSGNLIQNPLVLRKEVFANKKDKTSRAINGNGEIVNVVSTTLTIRFCDDIDQSDVIFLGTRKFIQKSPPINVEGRNAWLELNCDEVVPYGEKT